MNGDTNPEDQPDDEPKIIVDSDWKEQIAREKELAAEPPSETSVEPEPDLKPAVPENSSNPPPPPASFEVLITMLFTQAMTLLGQAPDPASNEVSINKPYAKHYIDTLEMLDEKTEGNLTDTESTMLSEALHALRLTYVNVKS